jgi:serine/threonine protein phosphatase PrpC
MFKLVAGNTSNTDSPKQPRSSFVFAESNDLAFAAHAGSLAIVADGLGEPEMGEMASRAAVAAFQIAYARKGSREAIPDALRRSLHEANVAVLALAAQMGRRSNVGTTLAAAVIHDKSLYWICVGDTRLYLLRDGRLAQVNADHVAGSKAWPPVIAGWLEGKQPRNELAAVEGRTARVASSLGRNYLGQNSLGQVQLVHVDAAVRGYPLREEDVVLLCSAGVYRSISEAEIAAAFLHGSPASACETVKAWSLAQDRARPEDLTLVAIRCQWTMPLAPALAPRSTQQLGRILVAAVCLAILLTSWMAADAVSDYWLAAKSQQTHGAHQVQPAVVTAPPHPFLPKPSAAKRVSEPVEKPSEDNTARPVENLNDND